MSTTNEPEFEPPQREAAPLQSEIEHQLEIENEPVYSKYAVLKIPDYRRYLLGGALAAAGSQMTNVAAGWELYTRTNAPSSLAILGLMSALPVIFLALPAGTLADRHDRRRIALLAQTGAATCLMLLALVSYLKLPLAFFYGLILLNGVCGAFLGPALGALVTNVVPLQLIPEATKWSSIRWQLASTIGPVTGGILIRYFGSQFEIYAIDALGRLIFCVFLAQMNPLAQTRSREKLGWESVAAGWKFVRSQPMILSTITLDMVAVLFGGATALLPIYAKDILHVGADGFGWLRAAPAVGAIVMALFLTIRPPMKHAGRALLCAVAAFGAATIVFGLSRNFFLSLGALAALGAADNISVVVRSTLVQLLTPDEMRGRVNAVNSVFISTSNEIGEVESGFAAQFLTPVIAVAGGGFITILIALGVAFAWPQVRRLGRLEDIKVAT